MGPGQEGAEGRSLGDVDGDSPSRGTASAFPGDRAEWAGEEPLRALQQVWLRGQKQAPGDQRAVYCGSQAGDSGHHPAKGQRQETCLESRHLAQLFAIRVNVAYERKRRAQDDPRVQAKQLGRRRCHHMRQRRWAGQVLGRTARWRLGERWILWGPGVRGPNRIEKQAMVDSGELLTKHLPNH